jgi:hypothetical protein
MFDLPEYGLFSLDPEFSLFIFISQHLKTIRVWHSNDVFPISPYGDTAKPRNFPAVHSGGQDAAALDLWRCGAWNRSNIFPNLDEYEPEFLVEDCGRDVWPTPSASVFCLALQFSMPLVFTVSEAITNL